MSFASLGLSEPICHVVAKLGYVEPTEIQQRVIAPVLAGQDVIATAQTGTGKSASFLLPLLQRFEDQSPPRPKHVRGVILSPTRELALQLHQAIGRYGAYGRQRSVAVYGGADLEAQRQALIEGADFLVATPGRLLDLLYQGAVRFDDVQALVLDEADKMLAMGFIDTITKLIDRLPSTRQNLMFSATMAPPLRSLAKQMMAGSRPKEISIDRQRGAARTIQQWLVTVDKDTKSALLSHLIGHYRWQQGLIFIGTKHGAAKLVEQLGKRGIKAEAFHSGKSQASRERALAQFKAGELPFLIATGVAARGLDIEGLARVINYDLPYESDEFIHRIGRTGRAGSAGEAVSLVSRDDFKNLCAIESRLGQLIERREIEGFSPRKEVPISILNYRPKQKISHHGKRVTEQKPAKRANSRSNKGPAQAAKAAPKPPAKNQPPKARPAFNPWANATKRDD